MIAATKSALASIPASVKGTIGTISAGAGILGSVQAWTDGLRLTSICVGLVVAILTAACLALDFKKKWRRELAEEKAEECRRLAGGTLPKDCPMNERNQDDGSGTNILP